MQTLHVTSAEVSFTGLSEGEEIFLTYSPLAGDTRPYIVDLENSFSTNTRNINVPDLPDGTKIGGPVKVQFELSSEFNSLTIYAVPENGASIEIFKASFSDLISEESLNASINLVIEYMGASGNLLPQQLEALSLARSGSHTVITNELTTKMNDTIPELLQDHTKEERGLAALIRAVKIAQKLEQKRLQP